MTATATDVFTCDLAEQFCSPVQTPKVDFAEFPASVNKWTPINTGTGDAYTTDQAYDYVGVGYTGVEGYYTGLVGPWAGSYGCSTDEQGTSWVNYSGYRFLTGTEMLCAWGGLNLITHGAWMINYSDNLTLTEFVFSTYGANLTSGWKPQNEDQASSIFSSQSASWQASSSTISGTESTHSDNPNTSSGTTSTSTSSSGATPSTTSRTSSAPLETSGTLPSTSLTYSSTAPTSSSTASGDVAGMNPSTFWVMIAVIGAAVVLLIAFCLMTVTKKEEDTVVTYKKARVKDDSEDSDDALGVGRRRQRRKRLEKNPRRKMSPVVSDEEFIV